MVMLPPQSSRGVLGLRATVSACPTYQLSRSQEPPGILRTKRSRPADGGCRDSNWGLGIQTQPREAGIHQSRYQELFGKRALDAACTV